MANRRSVLIGLGGLVAGGGALVGTGAFDTVTAERTVSVETAGDANALLGLEAAGEGNDAYVDTSGDTIAINLDADNGPGGLNQEAKTIIRNLITVTNNGTQGVGSITLTMSASGNASGVPVDDTFSFTVSPSDGSSDQTVSNGDDILTGNNSLDDTLSSGDSVNFGMIVDLISGGVDNDLPGDGSYTLTIEAQAVDGN